MELNRPQTVTAGFLTLALLAGCQGPKAYEVGDIGPAPFLRNVAPVAYSRVDPAPDTVRNPAPAYTIESVAVDTVPQPTYILDSPPETVRMAEPIVEVDTYSDVTALPLEYSAPTVEPIVYTEVAPDGVAVPEPSYVIESEAPAFGGTSYIEQAPAYAPDPVPTYASEALPLPSPPAGIEVEIIPPQPVPAAPAIVQPGLAGYGEAF